MARPELRIVGGTESKEGYENSFVLSSEQITVLIARLDARMRGEDGEIVVARRFLDDVEALIEVLCRNVCRMSEAQLRAFEEAL